jgi:hypothetical protein
MEQLLQLGHLHQLVIISGYVPHELKIVTDSNGKYQMKFNIRSFDNDGFATLLPCIAYGDIAKNIYDQLTNKDSVVIWGQLKTKFNYQVRDTYMTIKVLSYSITAATNIFARDGVLTKEKQEFVEWALRKYDENTPPPSNEEIAYWRQYWKDYKKDYTKETKNTFKEIKKGKKDDKDSN